MSSDNFIFVDAKDYDRIFGAPKISIPGSPVKFVCDNKIGELVTTSLICADSKPPGERERELE